MTYPELKIALDMGDPETVLSSISDLYNNIVDLKYRGCYFIVCDDGDVHCFDKNGKEYEIDYIPDNCFAHRFFDKIIIPKTATSIGDSAFWNCNKLTSVTIPNSVTIIRDYAFSGCRGLTSVTIPNSVTSIGAYAFWSCSNLTDVTMSSNIEHIGKDAFYGCDRLKKVLFKGKTIEQVKAMENYPWGIEDESIIQAGL